MRLLALDIGKRRTGVAFFDEATGVPLPLDTLTHTSTDELLTLIETLVRERKIDRLIVGLPLLPSGKDGAQSEYVRSVAESLKERGMAVSLMDERYSNPTDSTKNRDAYAAWNLLQTAVSKKSL